MTSTWIFRNPRGVVVTMWEPALKGKTTNQNYLKPNKEETSVPKVNGETAPDAPNERHSVQYQERRW